MEKLFIIGASNPDIDNLLKLYEGKVKEILKFDNLFEFRKKITTEAPGVIFVADNLKEKRIEDLLTSIKELENCRDVLIVGLNTDNSVQRLKGDKRPIINEDERAKIISNLKPVDYVIFFDEDTPAELINELVPDILIKGADWNINEIVGGGTVLANGGEVKTIEFVNDQSTSKIIDLITSRYSK